MSKIVLDDTAGGYNLSKINANLQKIEDALNNEVLYRDNPEGEPNAMSNDLDMNGHRVYNLPEPLSPSEAARLQDIQNAISGGAANLITFTPTGDIVATNVQAAIAEVDSELHNVDDTIRSDYADTASPLKGDALIGVRQPFTGAVGRTQHQKNIEFISIADFGAVPGAAAAANTLAIQRAHDASLYVYYPPGDYLVTGKIAVRVGTRIQGESAGSTRLLLDVDMAGATDALFECKVPAASFDTQQAGIVVRDIALIGNGNFGHGFLLQNIRFPIFENVWIFSFNGAALLCDYVEEGFFNFLNINGCGRTSGNVNLTADTLYGQITFDSSAAAVPGVSSNFLRFNDCTVANDRCSGTFMTKAGSPSRIYISKCQSELSGAAIGNRDWLTANNHGGIFFIEGCDVVNYRGCFMNVQFVELYATSNRVTNSTYYYSGANGTGAYRGQGNASNGAVEYVSVSGFYSHNDALGACNFQFIFSVQLHGCQLASLIVNDVSGAPNVRVLGCQVAGNVSVSDYPNSSLIAFNTIGGSASYGVVPVFGNYVVGTETFGTFTQMPREHTMSVTAAAALALPLSSDVVLVSGNTNITSIANASSLPGRRITLVFSGTPTVVDGGNIRLSANFVASADDTLTLVCDGTNFYEAGRSTN